MERRRSDGTRHLVALPGGAAGGRDGGADGPTRSELAEALSAAVAGEEIVPHYQPIVDLASGQVVGAEALARWPRAPSPAIGTPGRFLPLAGSTGLHAALTDQLLRQVCRDFARPDVAACGLWVSVNLSGIELVSPDLVLRVRRVLERSRLPPERFMVEVAEHLVPEPATVRALDQLAAVGVRLAVDDFGTGWSTVAELARLPIEVVKLDQSMLVRRPEHGGAVLLATVSMLASLGLTVLVEGIETAAHLSLARATSIQLAQGFHWSPAVPIDGFLRLARALDGDPG